MPSSTGAMHDPGVPGWRSARKSSLGLATSSRPASAIWNTPTSWVEPKRFFTARRMRKACPRSPSKASTASTRCSSTRGPARVPSFVTWPTSTSAVPWALAVAASSAALSRTCATDPGADSTRSVRTVWIESTITTAGRASRHGSASASTRVSESASSRAGTSPSRSARSRTCSRLSSPVT